MRRSSRWDRLLPKYTLGHRDRTLLISKLSNRDRSRLNRTLGHPDRTLLNRESGQPDRPFPNCTLGQRERTLLNCTVSYPDRSLPTSACTNCNDRYLAAALNTRNKDTPNRAVVTHDDHTKATPWRIEPGRKEERRCGCSTVLWESPCEAQRGSVRAW
jgi:hypothetical protein